MNISCITTRIKKLESAKGNILPIYIPIIRRFGEAAPVTEPNDGVIIKRFDGSVDKGGGA